jgi:hypothetical protein
MLHSLYLDERSISDSHGPGERLGWQSGLRQAVESGEAVVIRWERQADGSWRGFSGELLIGIVARDAGSERERWTWRLTGFERPKFWRRPKGHRTAWLAARRAAEAYWQRWLDAAALEPDLARLALQSLPEDERPKARRRTSRT